MTFAQLIECNIRKNFYEKPYQISAGETSRRPFSEKLKLSISLNQLSSYSFLFLYTVCFYCMQSRGLLKYIETKLQITCFYLKLGFL